MKFVQMNNNFSSGVFETDFVLGVCVDLGSGVETSFYGSINFRKLARDVKYGISISRSLIVFEYTGLSWIVSGRILLKPAIDFELRFIEFRQIDFSAGVYGGSKASGYFMIFLVRSTEGYILGGQNTL